MTPPKAQSKAIPSNGKILSPVQQYARITVKNGAELKRMLKIPRGRYLVAEVKHKKAIVPAQHLISNVQR